MSTVGGVIDEHGSVDGHCFQIGGAGGDPRDRRPVPATVASPVAVAPVAHQAAATRRPSEPRVLPDAPSAGQIVKQLKARLRVVEREIKAREKLEQERSQIKRLIAAATIERDNVRRLRSAG